MTQREFPYSEIFGLTPAAATQSLSQLTTSFIGSMRQGIPHVLLVFFFLDENLYWPTIRNHLQITYSFNLLINVYSNVKDPINQSFILINISKVY